MHCGTISLSCYNYVGFLKKYTKLTMYMRTIKLSNGVPRSKQQNGATITEKLIHTQNTRPVSIIRCKVNVDESNRMMLHVAWPRKPRTLHKHLNMRTWYSSDQSNR